MRVLVTYGSTRGGTEQLAAVVADDLREEGFPVDLLAPRKVRTLDEYGAVVVGGALYASRWHKEARRFVRRHARELRQRPTYFFSSGPLDDSASRAPIPEVKGVHALMRRVNARDHVTFGGGSNPTPRVSRPAPWPRRKRVTGAIRRRSGPGCTASPNSSAPAARRNPRLKPGAYLALRSVAADPTRVISALKPACRCAAGNGGGLRSRLGKGGARGRRRRAG